MAYTLITGGCGYIGSHTVLTLLEAGRHIVVFDNLSNSSPESLKRVEKLTGKKISFIQGDIRNSDQLDACFKQYDISSAIHFAGLKAVGESCEIPLEYYENNVSGTINLLQAMQNAEVYNFVFSSSATVYKESEIQPLTEQMPIGAYNPYGRTKQFIEDILIDLNKSNKQWNIALLRYFNPVGAHPSGLIGEDPKGIPNNLMPYISQVAVGKLKELGVFGNDYPTKDGTGVRDYIHVVDLAKGHLAALEFLEKENPGLEIFNLGSGVGHSVLEMVEAFSRVNQVDIPYSIKPRRAGDIALFYADPSKAFEKMGWKTELTLDDMVRDNWNWQKNNPGGY